MGLVSLLVTCFVCTLRGPAMKSCINGEEVLGLSPFLTSRSFVCSYCKKE